METDARNAIAHAVMLLIYHKSVLPVIVILEPYPPLRSVQRNRLVDRFIYNLLKILFIFEVSRDPDNSLGKCLIHISRLLPVVISKDLNNVRSQLKFLDHVFSSFRTHAVVIVLLYFGD